MSINLSMEDITMDLYCAPDRVRGKMCGPFVTCNILRATWALIESKICTKYSYNSLVLFLRFASGVDADSDRARRQLVTVAITVENSYSRLLVACMESLWL